MNAKEKNTTIYILALIGIAGYVFYNKWKKEKEEKELTEDEAKRRGLILDNSYFTEERGRSFVSKELYENKDPEFMAHVTHLQQKLNEAIKLYLKKTRFSGPIYTNSLEFATYLRQAVPDSLAYLFSDMFEKISLYENYVRELSYKKLPNNTYQVTLRVGSAKFYSDDVGKLTAVPVNDYVDIGIFKKSGSTDEPLLLKRIRMDQPEKTFEFIVKEEPASAGIDPYLLLIDRSPDNNLYKFSEKPSVPEL